MIIEDLIRLGRALLAGELEARVLVEMLTDVSETTTKNFYQNVFVVELGDGGGEAGLPVVLPVQRWGDEVPVPDKPKKTELRVDVERAAGAPIVLPRGGNPLVPQGRYGLPAYPLYEAHVRGFAEGAGKAAEFLAGRVKRTQGLTLAPAVLHAAAEGLHAEAKRLALDSKQKVLGVLVLARCGEADPYRYAPGTSSDRAIGRSAKRPGEQILPRAEVFGERLWEGKIEEGRSAGARDGRCSICGGPGPVVSAYNKAWPWLTPTWTCPLPHAGDKDRMVEMVALDDACYRALTAGASVFSKLSRQVHVEVTRELFSPVADPEARRIAGEKSITDIPKILGGAFVVPVHRDLTEDPEEAADLCRLTLEMMAEDGKGAAAAGRMGHHLADIVGFDCWLPRAAAQRAEYRMKILYYSGDPSRADIHLRAVIDDVAPTVMPRLEALARRTGDEAVALAREIIRKPSDKQLAFYKRRFGAVPYLLGRGYGGAYLWERLQSAFHRRPMDAARPTANSAHRLAGLAAHYPDSNPQVAEEVVFFLAFRGFLERYNNQLANTRSTPMSMRPWRELLSVVFEAPIEEIHFQSPAEIGFAAGALLRRFGRWYYHATDRDLLKHRVMTFGSDLSPLAVWHRGVARIFDVAARHDKIKMPEDFRRRVGAILAELDRLADGVRSDRDGFMTGFWSGHALEPSTQHKEEV
ncbi:MAG: hypothetical protein HYV63_10750 [Candidatus Schekmanbacteria bacterium]|nr:hypothetical protein [Candidatus Schekmanbacteria bacterium]